MSGGWWEICLSTFSFLDFEGFWGEDKSRNLISDSIADSIFFPFTIHNLMMLPLAIVENAEHENHDGYNISFDRLCNPEK